MLEEGLTPLAGRYSVAILDAIEVQRKELRESAAAAIRKVEAQYDEERRRLDRAAAALGGPPARSAPTGPPSSAAGQPSAKPRRRRRRKGRNPAEEARERCEAVLRYFEEQAQPLAPIDVGRALKISRHETRTALGRLSEAGRITRTGSGRATRYALKSGGSQARRLASVPSPPDQGTLEGRLLEILEDRGSASLRELVQATGATPEAVQAACGALVAEELIQMGRRDGRSVYVFRRAA